MIVRLKEGDHLLIKHQREDGAVKIEGPAIIELHKEEIPTVTMILQTSSPNRSHAGGVLNSISSLMNRYGAPKGIYHHVPSGAILAQK